MYAKFYWPSVSLSLTTISDPNPAHDILSLSLGTGISVATDADPEQQ